MFSWECRQGEKSKSITTHKNDCRVKQVTLATVPFGVIRFVMYTLRNTPKCVQQLSNLRMQAASVLLAQRFQLRLACSFNGDQRQLALPRIRFMDARPIHQGQRGPPPRVIWAVFGFQSWWQGWNVGQGTIRQNSSVHIAARLQARCGTGASN